MDGDWAASPDERRGVERRLEMLERQYLQMQATLQKIELMQDRAQEVLDSRYETTCKGQDLLGVKLDSLEVKIGILASSRERMAGAMQLIGWVGMAGVVTAVLWLLKTFTAGGARP